MKIFNFDQYSTEWAQTRAGVITGSSLGLVMTILKNGSPSATLKKYLDGVAIERWSGAPLPPNSGVQSFAMKRGHDEEESARAEYSVRAGIEIKEVGFILDDSGRLGVSPDGVIYADELRGVEIKSFYDTDKVFDILSGTVPESVMPQIQGSMLVTGWKSWDFVGWLPFLESKGRDLTVIRVQRDGAYISKLQRALNMCESYINQRISLIDVQNV